jgi:hypothetical protein
MEKHRYPCGRHEVVGGDLVRSSVIRLRHRFAEQVVRLVQAAEPVDARQQVVRDAVHHLPDVAVHVRMQPTEIGDARRGTHATEKAVAFDKQRGMPRACRRHGRGNARWSAA